MKQVAQEEHFEFEESAWTDLEKALDAQLPVSSKKKFWSRGMLLLASFLVLGTLATTIFLRSNHSEKSEQSAKANSIHNRVPPVAPENEQQERIQGSELEESRQGRINAENPSNLHDELDKNKKQGLSKPSSAIHGTKDETLRADQIEEAASDYLTLKENASTPTTQALSQSKNQKNRNGISTTNLKKGSEKAGSISNTDLLLPYVHPKAAHNLTTAPIELSIGTSFLGEDLIGKSNLDHKIALPNPENKKYKWGLLASVGGGFQELNNPHASFSNSSLYYGAQIGAILNNAFSLSIGLYRYQFNFEADSMGFSGSETYWNTDYPSQIRGEIAVVEVPLLLGFHFPRLNGAHALRFGLELGLNSTFVGTEKYEFAYSSANPTLVDELTGKWVNQHWFNTLQAGIKISYQLTPFLEVGTKPFLRYNTVGIGLGAIQSNAIGNLFYLQVKL